MLEKSTLASTIRSGTNAPHGKTSRMWPTLPWCIRSRSSSVSRVCGTTPKNSFGALGTVVGSSVEPLLSLPQPVMPRRQATGGRERGEGRFHSREG